MAKKLSKRNINIIKDYIDYLKKDGLNISKAFIFGSYANGKANKYSDIDLCIVSADFKDRIEGGAYLSKKLYYSHILDCDNNYIDFDLIGYPSKDFNDSLLANEIKKTGIRIV